MSDRAIAHLAEGNGTAGRTAPYPPPTAVPPPTEQWPPAAVPQRPPAAYPPYGAGTTPPGYPQQPQQSSSLGVAALVLLGLVALAGIAVGALAAAGVFSQSPATHAVTTRVIKEVAPTARPTHRGGASTSSSGGSAQGSAATASGTTSCGGDLSVGPNTSCGFAQNVEAAYDQSAGGDQAVTAYSPATGQTYVIDCSGGTPHVCTGGTTQGASIYFGSSPGSSASVPSGTTSCGGGLSVGPNTSCGFAQNVENAYDASGGGDTEVTAFSPATGQTYVIDCSGGSPHVCTGGTTQGASVYFP